jgi:hypothetical protein
MRSCVAQGDLNMPWMLLGLSNVRKLDDAQTESASITLDVHYLGMLAMTLASAESWLDATTKTIAVNLMTYGDMQNTQMQKLVNLPL